MMNWSFIHKKWFRYGLMPVLCLVCLLLTTFVLVQILKGTNYMGVRLQEVYSNLFDGKIDDNSQMNVSIQTNNCTLEATYAGDTFQQVKATNAKKGFEEKCQAFNYENGQRPSKLTDELVNRDLERVYNRKNPL